jgi:hypothetical protein
MKSLGHRGMSHLYSLLELVAIHDNHDVAHTPVKRLWPSLLAARSQCGEKWHQVLVARVCLRGIWAQAPVVQQRSRIELLRRRYTFKKDAIFFKTLFNYFEGGFNHSARGLIYFASLHESPLKSCTTNSLTIDKPGTSDL